jgi:hypothetical protein
MPLRHILYFVIPSRARNLCCSCPFQFLRFLARLGMTISPVMVYLNRKDSKYQLRTTNYTELHTAGKTPGPPAEPVPQGVARRLGWIWHRPSGGYSPFWLPADSRMLRRRHGTDVLSTRREMATRDGNGETPRKLTTETAPRSYYKISCRRGAPRPTGALGSEPNPRPGPSSSE